MFIEFVDRIIALSIKLPFPHSKLRVVWQNLYLFLRKRTWSKGANNLHSGKQMVVLKIGNTFKNGEMFSNMTPIEYSCSMIVAHLVINPLDAIGIFLNKQNFIYRVLASSIITPYKLLWTYGGSGHIYMYVSAAG